MYRVLIIYFHTLATFLSGSNCPVRKTLLVKLCSRLLPLMDPLVQWIVANAKSGPLRLSLSPYPLEHHTHSKITAINLIITIVRTFPTLI